MEIIFSPAFTVCEEELPFDVFVRFALSLSCVCVFRTHAYTSIYFSHIPLRLSIRGRQCRSRLNVFPFYTAASLFSFRCFAHCIRITTSICFFFLFLIIHSRSPFVVVVSVVAVDSAAFLPIGQFMLFSFHRIPHTRWCFAATQRRWLSMPHMCKWVAAKYPNNEHVLYVHAFHPFRTKITSLRVAHLHTRIHKCTYHQLYFVLCLLVRILAYEERA